MSNNEKQRIPIDCDNCEHAEKLPDGSIRCHGVKISDEHRDAITDYLASWMPCCPCQKPKGGE
jgi:hypothetical protein